MPARFFALLQYLLPKYWMTALVWRLARIRKPAIKNALIRGFAKLYKVQLDEVAREVPDDFGTFNDFFTRALAEGQRPVDKATTSVVSPVDGTLSMAGALDGNTLIQAKGLDYTLEDLFAIDLEEARAYTNGSYATIYLAPYNYHRVHMPFDGKLLAAHYVPGDLFSVNAATAAHVPGLFRRNERLNLHFETAFGPAALVFVGALHVGSITTPWTGEIRPRKRGVVETLDVSHGDAEVNKGDLLGWFNMGSTVILLIPEGAAKWRESFDPGTTVCVGESIAVLQAAGQ